MKLAIGTLVLAAAFGISAQNAQAADICSYTKVLSEPVMIAPATTTVVERPLLLERTITHPVLLEKPIMVQKVVSQPVAVNQCVSSPVLIDRHRVIENPVIIERKRDNLLNLNVADLFRLGLL